MAALVPTAGSGKVVIDPQRSRGTTARSLSFPSEILILILSFVSDSYTTPRYIGSLYQILIARNAGLAPLALVNRAFQAATYSDLYGDLRLAWMADTLSHLHKSFSANSELLPLVRRLEACAVSETGWVETNCERKRGNGYLRELWLDSLIVREGIMEGSERWDRLLNLSIEEGIGADDFICDMRDAAQDDWDTAGHGAWRDRSNNPEGALELLDLVESAPALQSLVVRDFWYALRPADIASYGPYPLLESLQFEYPPFPINMTLPSLLTSWAPNLRSLSGPMDSFHPDDIRRTPIIIARLPLSLSHLEIEDFDFHDLQIRSLLLLQAQSNLRSLTVAPVQSCWVSLPAMTTLFSSLDTLIIIERSRGPPSLEAMDLLALAISSSSSLRHLELVTARAPLVASLPPSLQSITLTPLRGHYSYSGVPKEIERFHGLFKKAGIQPLRVEFAARQNNLESAREAGDKWRDAYAVEGHTLTTCSVPE
ncbi:hypothetical protein RQP46_004272 [Phenoliferia psychrophenolica]